MHKNKFSVSALKQRFRDKDDLMLADVHFRQSANNSSGKNLSVSIGTRLHLKAASLADTGHRDARARP